MSFARVLAPVDFSDHSLVSAKVAWQLTAKTGELVLLHVDEIPDLSGLATDAMNLPHAAWEGVRRQHEHEFSHKLNEIIRELDRENKKEAQVRALVRAGDPVEAIARCAQEWPPDLLVIGSHGESGSLRFLFGSVAAKIAWQAPCPVLVTRPGRGEDIAQRGRFRSALVGVDYSPLSALVAKWAARLVGEGAVHLVHVWQRPDGVELERESEVRRMQEFVAALDPAQWPGELRTHVEVNHPAQGILELADELDVDLIVVGAHGRHGVLERIVGTAADRVLRHAKVPVLLIPEAAFAASETAAE